MFFSVFPDRLLEPRCYIQSKKRLSKPSWEHRMLRSKSGIELSNKNIICPSTFRIGTGFWYGAKDGYWFSPFFDSILQGDPNLSVIYLNEKRGDNWNLLSVVPAADFHPNDLSILHCSWKIQFLTDCATFYIAEKSFPKFSVTIYRKRDFRNI